MCVCLRISSLSVCSQTSLLSQPDHTSLMFRMHQQRPETSCKYEWIRVPVSGQAVLFCCLSGWRHSRSVCCSPCDRDSPAACHHRCPATTATSPTSTGAPDSAVPSQPLLEPQAGSRSLTHTPISSGSRGLCCFCPCLDETRRGGGCLSFCLPLCMCGWVHA